MVGLTLWILKGVREVFREVDHKWYDSWMTGVC